MSLLRSTCSHTAADVRVVPPAWRRSGHMLTGSRAAGGEGKVLVGWNRSLYSLLCNRTGPALHRILGRRLYIARCDLPCEETVAFGQTLYLLRNVLTSSAN